MFTDVIILAGGFGERLWPASNSAFPKQFMSLEGGHSFLQEAVQRAVALDITGNILVITRKEISETVINQCAALIDSYDDSQKNILSERLFVLEEPMPIHTAGAVAFGCHFLNRQFSGYEHTILVLTSDHVIEPTNTFIEDTETAYKVAKAGYFVCFAIQPKNPCTGYGYIKPGKQLDNVCSCNSNSSSLFMIEQFKEKPDSDTAKKYLSEGYFWNSGMFGFRADFFMNELEKFEPTLHKAFSVLAVNDMPELSIINGIHCIKRWNDLDEVYEKSPKVSIDNGIAEKTDKACAVKASFAWKDIGTWDTFSSLFSEKLDKTADIESKNCFVYSDIPVALCGVSDLIVVVKNNRVLVMKKGCSPLAKTAAHLIDGE